MELQLQPLAATCAVSGQPFADGDRVASYLVRTTTGEVARFDALEKHAAEYTPEGVVACRWVHVFKPRKAHENPERELKLTAENLFLTLLDPANELSVDNVRLVQFLALMLERKRVIKPKGRTADGAKNVYEHSKTKQLLEVPAGELTPEFFMQVQEQLSVLVGEPKQRAEGPKG